MLIDRLIDRIRELNNPSVIGLDPMPEYVPSHIMEGNIQKHGETLDAVASAFLDFNIGIIDEICGIVPAVKPQIAMYEQLGAAGIECYIKTCEYAKGKGLIVIGDIKRSDIASSAAAYSAGHIGQTNVCGKSLSAFDADFITVNPYLGADAVEPFVTDCKKYDKGMFILVKTSNPGGGLFQNLISEGKEVYKHVGEYVEKIAVESVSGSGFSNIGAVVGATYPNELKELRELMPHVFFLIPGYGAQGGTAKDIVPAFNKGGVGAIVNSSRGIICAYKSERFKADDKNFAKAARQAAIAMKEDLQKGI